VSVVAGVGLSSGIDYNELISNLMELERQPLYRLQDRQSDYNDKISIYNELSSKLSTLKSAADTLRTTSGFYAKSVSVEDETVLEASVTSTATTGNYVVAPHSSETSIVLASEEKEVHSGVTSSSTVINNSGADKVFQYTYAGTQRTLTVSDGTTLEELRDLINDDSGNPGVTATITYDGSNYRLVLTGDDTGSSNTITIDSGTTLDGTGGTVDFTSSAFTETKSAQDAKLSIDGIDITSSSNTISGVIPGVTLTLKESTSSSITVSVTNDISTIRSNIEAFVNAYNDVVTYVSANSTYDTDTHTGGALFGESTPRIILSRLRSILTGRVSGQPEDMRVLSQLGISTDYTTGTLSISTSTLETKLSEDLDDVAGLFTDSSEGIATQIYDYLDDVTDSYDGTIAIRIDGLEDLVEDLQAEISEMEDQLDRTEQNLRLQFANLEALLSALTSQGSFLNSLTTQWSS